MNSYMNSYMRIWIHIWIHSQTLLCTVEFICFFHEFIYEFMIFYEFIYESTVWIHIQALLGILPRLLQSHLPHYLLVCLPELSYIKMHFSYVKSKILSMWLNILLKFYVTMFSPEHSLLLRSIPLRPPGPPPDPTPHPTPPFTPPCQPPHPAGLPSQTALPASSATTASRALQRASAVLVLLQRLCVGCKSTCNPLQFSTHPI